MASWQSKGSNWLAKNEFLFNNVLMSDCAFRITLENVKIPAHKYILGGSSAVFYNFYYEMKANFNEITVEDVSVDNFLVFLKFLYTGKNEFNMKNIADILKLADRYSINNLTQICSDFLIKKLKIDNALNFMERYSTYQLNNFDDFCINLISKNRLIFENSLFYEISKNTLQKILISKELSGFKEITIYNGVNKWAERFCQKNQQLVNSENKRSALGSALHFIRFGTMNIQEFTSCTVNNPILNTGEIESIFIYIGSDGKTDCKYSGEKRKRNRNIFKFSNLTPTVNYYGFNTYDLFNFTVSKSIEFNGVVIHGRARSALEESISQFENFNIKLLNENRDILVEYTSTVEHNGTETGYCLGQYRLVLLNANQKYIVHIEGEETASKFINYQLSEKIIKKEENGVMFNIRDNNYVGAGIVYSV